MPSANIACCVKMCIRCSIDVKVEDLWPGAGDAGPLHPADPPRHARHLHPRPRRQCVLLLREDIPPGSLQENPVSKHCLMSSMHQNQNLFLRTVFKYSFLFVPSSVIAAVCFVLSQREVTATLETFSVFNILAAAALLYIVLSSSESRSVSQYSLKAPVGLCL